MAAFPRRTVILLIPIAAGIGCGDGPNPPSEAGALTTVEFVPDTATLFTTPPGNTAQLTVVAEDQNGDAMSDVDPAEFISEDEAVATVGEDGTVTAAAPGSTAITASVTAGGITRSGSATVTVRVPAASARVEAPDVSFNPRVVDVTVGGTVTWVISALPHDVTFTTPNAPPGVPPSQNVSVSRTFTTHGVFQYMCLFHPAMTGSVRVH